MLATWPKIGQKLVPKEVKVVPNWVQNRCLAGPDAPTRTEAPTANSRPRFWTLFGVPFGFKIELGSDTHRMYVLYAKTYTFGS